MDLGINNYLVVFCSSFALLFDIIHHYEWLYTDYHANLPVPSPGSLAYIFYLAVLSYFVVTRTIIMSNRGGMILSSSAMPLVGLDSHDNNMKL